jgi:hypothetical protein
MTRKRGITKKGTVPWQRRTIGNRNDMEEAAKQVTASRRNTTNSAANRMFDLPTAMKHLYAKKMSQQLDAALLRIAVK